MRRSSGLHLIIDMYQVCAVAAQPGHTKELQTVQLERGIKIIDSPGVVFDAEDFDDGKSQAKSNVLLRNVVKVEDIEDPIALGLAFIIYYFSGNFLIYLLLRFQLKRSLNERIQNF